MLRVSHRTFILARLLLCFAALALVPPRLAAAQEGVRVAEVAMAAPDVVLLELEDPAFVRGRIVALDAPRSEAQGTWVEHEGGWGLVIGPKGDHLRLSDTPPSRFLDRIAVDEAAAWGPIGGRRVVSVFRKSMPYDSGLYRGPNGDSRTGASFRHSVYLQLDGPLVEGDHAMEGPASLPAGTRLRFDDAATRASAVHATQLGHRAGDRAKTAFLSLWLPGGPEGGAVDFRRYGIDRFAVLDAGGRSVFEGAVRLRAAPDAPEPGNGLPAELVETLDAAVAPLEISGIEADGRVRTREAHGFADGQRVGLKRLGGEQDATALFATVADPDGTSFGLREAEGALPERASIEASVAPARRVNRAGTFVFELDYSAWRPEGAGTYRLQVPGLGVSDPFEIADDIWLRSARNSIAGLYNHRSGIALDGRFDYSRPATFRPGADMRILKSRLPLSWSSEFDGFVPFSQGAAAPWITQTEAPANAWGGYMDAGDWDRRIQHVEIASLLLEVEEVLREKGQNPLLGVPRSAQVLDDPIYAEANGLPDLVHEAIWGLDFFRRLQQPDGGIPGGIESAEHPLAGEPSFLEHLQVFLYAPDPLSSYRYAGVAAKLVRALRAQKADDLAELFEASALAAWRWAEAARSDPDAAYAEAIAAGEASGAVDAASWPERRAALEARTDEHRVAAAASLFRLTGEHSYATVFERAWREGWDLYAHKGDAAWDYLRADGHDEAVGAEVRRMIEGEADLNVSTQAGLSYPAMKHPFAPAGWGQGGPPDYGATMLLMRAHRLTGDPAILQTMERAHHAMLGANQLGLSLVTGLGARNVSKGVLHVDSLAMGVPVPPGIAIYGWGPQASTAYGWIFGPPWSPLPESGTEENAAARRIEPSRFALPYFEYLVQHPALVMQMEYTVQQTIAPMATLALYLSAQ